MNSIFDDSDAQEEEEIVRNIERIRDLRIEPSQVLLEGHLFMPVDEDTVKEGYFLLLYDRLIY
jgi:hypothetical protein